MNAALFRAMPSHAVEEGFPTDALHEAQNVKGVEVAFFPEVKGIELNLVRASGIDSTQIDLAL